jgi:hypothetical protein
MQENHQKTLKDKEFEFQRTLQQTEEAWQDRLSSIKLQLAKEHSEYEEKLVQLRKSSDRRMDGGVSSPVSAIKRQEIDRLIKENDQAFTHQSRRKEYLERERKELDAMEEQLKERRQASYSLQAMIKTEEDKIKEYQAKLESLKQIAMNEEPLKLEALKTPESSYDDDLRENISESMVKQQPQSKQAMKEPKLTVLNESNDSLTNLDIQDDEDIDYDGSRLAREVKRRFEREERVLNQTKMFLQEQSSLIETKRGELEQVRQKWRNELEEPAIEKKTSHNDTVFNPSIAEEVIALSLPLNFRLV